MTTFFKCVLLTMLLSGFACAEEERGKLVFADGWGVQELDVVNGKVTTLWDGSEKNIALFTNSPLTRINDRQLIFGTIGAGDHLYVLDRETKKSTFLRSGFRPTYIPRHDKLFFLETVKEQQKIITRLFIADFNDPVHSAKQLTNYKYDSWLSLIPVSDDEVLIEAYESSVRILLLYNIPKMTLRKIAYTQTCEPVAWRAKTKQLICLNADSKKHVYLTDLEWKHPQYLDIGKDHQILGYIPELDRLILGRERFDLGRMAVVHDVEWYDFTTHSISRLKERQRMMGATIFWFRN